MSGLIQRKGAKTQSCKEELSAPLRLRAFALRVLLVRILMLLITAVLSFATACADEPDQKESRPGLGAVEGTLSYEADSKRRWRYARYYVDRKTDRLAEAVIVLTPDDDDLKFEKPEPRTIEIDQKNFMFVPETTAIRAGDRVRFLNSDRAVHNVAVTHLRHSFNVNLQPEQTHEESFPYGRKVTQPYRIGCIYHSAMRAWIYVFDHPLFDMTEKDGVFRIVNVPPGDYTLDIVHPAGDLRLTQKVTIEANETLKTDITLSPDDLQAKKTPGNKR